jgi:hypothetical protein
MGLPQNRLGRRSLQALGAFFGSEILLKRKKRFNIAARFEAGRLPLLPQTLMALAS